MATRRVKPTGRPADVMGSTPSGSGRRLSFKIRQLTDVSHCNLQHDFLRKRHRADRHGPDLPQEQRRVASAARASSHWPC
jgi:hypothetical protein